MHRWFLAIFAAAVSMYLTALNSAQALIININPVAGGGLESGPDAGGALAAFNRAADRWESYFSDPVTVEVDADLRNLGSSSIIGRAGSTMLRGGFNTIRNAMASDAANESDDSIVASLPNWSQFRALKPTGITLSNAISLTQANAMALGFARVTPSDALIEFNSGFSFDFDNSDGVVGMDFESVALHELGHVLGFVSAVDEIDYMLSKKQTGSLPLEALDLFRFGSNSNPSNATQFKTYPRQLKPGNAGYFDDLAKELRLSTGYYTGDKRQASHWRDDGLSGVLLGVMDPTLPLNFILPLTANDLRVMDRIGWEYGGGGSDGVNPVLTASNITVSGLHSSAIAEPAPIMLILSGFTYIISVRQRKSPAL